MPESSEPTTGNIKMTASLEDTGETVHQPDVYGAVPVANVGVKATWHPIHGDWAELRLFARLYSGGAWLPLTFGPLLVARRRSNGAEAPQLTAISAIKRVFTAADIPVKLSAGEVRLVGDDDSTTEYAWWATLHSRLTVGWSIRQDGTYLPMLLP